MPPINIQPIMTDEDLSQIVDIEQKAYGISSPLLQLMFPPTSTLPPTVLQRSKIDRHKHVWVSDPTAHYIKATISETSHGGKLHERIVGAAVYHIYEASHTASERNPWPKSSDEVPVGAHQALCLHYFRTLTEARLNYTKGTPHAFLANLVVDPSFQGLGIGTKLIESMVVNVIDKLACDGRLEEKASVACWLDASPRGLTLYRRLGWEAVGESRFDLEPWGGTQGQHHKNVHMLKWISMPGR